MKYNRVNIVKEIVINRDKAIIFLFRRFDPCFKQLTSNDS